MQSSRAQIIYNYLPGAVFRHDEGFFGQVAAVEGDRLQNLNQDVAFQEIATYLRQWPDDQRSDLPIPTEGMAREYVLVSPDMAHFDLFPLVFECTRLGCARVTVFYRPEELTAHPRCRKCKRGYLRQLMFYSAHNCGRTIQMRVPKCAVHGQTELSFQNTGSFTTATWRCHGTGCNGGVTSRTNQSPCSCNRYPGPDGRVIMRAHTLDDHRAFKAHSIDLINIDEPRFKDFQKHMKRAQIAIAHYLGHISELSEGIREAELSTDTPGAPRKTAEEWAEYESKLRATGLLSDAAIEAIFIQEGPKESGIVAASDLHPSLLEHYSNPEQRRFLERAGLFDRTLVPRTTLSEERERATTRGDHLASEALDLAGKEAARLGIAEVAVTYAFPIAKLAFAYTRESTVPEEAHLRGFRHEKYNEGKFPVYGVANDTEAVLITLSAMSILKFLQSRGEILELPEDETGARLAVLELFAIPEESVAVESIRTITHTLSHLLLRGLDDGQVGFSEAGLAEWIVPEALSFAVYANSLKDFKLGALWTLIQNRVLQWLQTSQVRVTRCENDPICYQRDPRSCERCLYVTFGCREFNRDLDRQLLHEFLLFQDSIVPGEA